MVMELKKTYIQTFKLTDTDCDMNHMILPGALLRMVQQVATAHCDVNGMDQAFYERNKVVFLLAKMAFQWQRVPMCGEELTLTTMPETARRVSYKRITKVTDAKGEEVGIVDSRWVLVDMESHRIIRRPPAAFEALPFADDVPFELDMTIHKPAELEEAGESKAAFTYCDTNHHLNNTRYADIVCDTLPLEQMRSKPVRGMIISYHNEVPAGEKFALQRAEEEDGSWYVAGIRNDKHCFEAKVMF